MKLRFVSIIVFAMMGANLAAADDTWRPEITAGPSISTLGIGADVGVRFNDFVGLRIGGNYLSFNVDVNSTDFDYDADFKFASDRRHDRRLSLHAGAASLRGLSIQRQFGRFLGDSERLRDARRHDVSGCRAGQVTGDLDFNKFAPYVGIGLEGRFFADRFILGAEAGVLFPGPAESRPAG